MNTKRPASDLGDEGAPRAISEVRDISAVRAPLADGWAYLPPASGAECARVLRRAGLQASLDGPDHVVLSRDRVPIVRVPLVERLRPELLVAILKTVGVSPTAFTRLLVES